MWVFNVFLMLCFYGNMDVYNAMVDAGATCYVNIGGAEGDAPPCPY